MEYVLTITVKTEVPNGQVEADLLDLLGGDLFSNANVTVQWEKRG